MLVAMNAAMVPENSVPHDLLWITAGVKVDNETSKNIAYKRPGRRCVYILLEIFSFSSLAHSDVKDE